MSIMKTFLVIEDEKFINQYISNSLEANGYKTYSALTGKEGLSQITSLCPDLLYLTSDSLIFDGLTISNRQEVGATFLLSSFQPEIMKLTK